ncbi:MAG: hypothetical protein M3Y91_15790 [Actinomycetota bacterium]|nr:hypothetical protein [Actinomycetota bacterium]
MVMIVVGCVLVARLVLPAPTVAPRGSAPSKEASGRSISPSDLYNPPTGPGVTRDPGSLAYSYTGVGQAVTLTCAGVDLTIEGSADTITIGGICGHITVVADASTLTMGGAQALTIAGSSNTLNVITTGTLTTNGNNNHVTYVSVLSPPSDHGIGNVMTESVQRLR